MAEEREVYTEDGTPSESEDEDERALCDRGKYCVDADEYGDDERVVALRHPDADTGLAFGAFATGRRANVPEWSLVLCDASGDCIGESG